eukprot:2890757-Amphidinium_carterae.1
MPPMPTCGSAPVKRFEFMRKCDACTSALKLSGSSPVKELLQRFNSMTAVMALMPLTGSTPVKRFSCMANA